MESPTKSMWVEYTLGLGDFSSVVYQVGIVAFQPECSQRTNGTDVN